MREFINTEINLYRYTKDGGMNMRSQDRFITEGSAGAIGKFNRGMERPLRIIRGSAEENGERGDTGVYGMKKILQEDEVSSGNAQILWELEYLYAPDMIGCRYFHDALELYASCLYTRAGCILHKEVYPVLAERYGTSGACIEMAIRRWIKRIWEIPHVRGLLLAASDGIIAERPSNKLLLHTLSRKMIWSSFPAHPKSDETRRRGGCGKTSAAPDIRYKRDALTSSFCGIISDTMRERGEQLGYKGTDQQDQ